MKKEDTSRFTGLVKALSFTLKQFRLYSEKHPIAQQALKTLESEIESSFQGQDKIKIGTTNHRLIVEGDALSEKDAVVQDLARECERLGIESLSLEKGLDLQEMTSLISLMAARSKTLESQGGFKKAFEASRFTHVKLASGKFQLVEEGDVVTTVSPQEHADLPIASIADIIRHIRKEGSTSRQSGPASELDCEKIVGELEKSPQVVAKFAVEGIQDAARFEQTIRRVIHSLVESLVPYLVKHGKDITKALEHFAKELERFAEKSGQGADFTELKKKIPQILEEETDELRIQMMARTAKEEHGDVKALAKMAAKLFKDDSIRSRLTPALKEELLKTGVSSRDFGALFTKIEEDLAKKKSRVTINAEELEELRRKAERFDEELEHHTKDTVKKLEREKKVILDEKERVDAVIRNLAEGLLVVDKNGKVVLMNPAAERLLGVQKSEKLGKPVTENLRPEHVVSLTRGNLRDEEGQVAKQVEVISLNDETKRVLQASSAVIENEDGRTIGMVSVISDVTKQKEVEELKSKFVSSVSHELRTPLMAIHKSIKLILEKEVGEVNTEQQKFLAIADRNLDRLSRLIDDLLDLSKLEAHKMKVEPKLFSAREELVTPVLASLETWLNDKKIKVESRFSPEKVTLEAGLDRITQVLVNLMGNAIKFTPNGGSIVVEVRGNVKDAAISSEPCVEIAVTDNGIGIDLKDQARIFEKFEQVSLLRPEGVSSTGLGLTLAREIVELHGGKIWVESEVGKGSRFAIRLPAKFRARHEARQSN